MYIFPMLQVQTLAGGMALLKVQNPILHCRAVFWQLAKTSTKLQKPIPYLLVGETIDN